MTSGRCLLRGRLRAALLRLNEWMTQAQAEWVIGELGHAEGSGIARNQRVHEDLIYGKPVSTATTSGPAEPDCAVLRFRAPGGRAERVRGDDAVSGASGQRAAEPGRRPAGGEAGPGAVRERDSAGSDGGEVALADGRVEVEGGAAATALPGSGREVARDGRAGTVSYEPAVRGALRGGGVLRDAGRTGKRVRGMEVGAALLRDRGGAAIWGRAEGAGATDRGAAGAGDAAGHPAGLRGV